MKSKKVHRFLGLLLVLPLVGWIVTGFIFLIKPGYSGAYEMVSPNLYPIEDVFTIDPKEDWVETRLLKTVLGHHLLVNNGRQWLHLDPQSMTEKARPSDADVVRLLEDALKFNKERYGVIQSSRDSEFITTTGIELSLDWNALRISQYGRDTKLIDTLYKIHYLQWLGNRQANNVLGVIGLLALTLLVIYGVVLYLRSRRKTMAS